MKATIEKITIKIGKKEIELTLEEAKELYAAMDDIFEKTQWVTVPSYPYFSYPQITYTITSGSTTATIGTENTTA